MGRVFKPEAIAAQDVPESGAHELAGRYILNQLFEPHEDWDNEIRTWFSLGDNGIQSGMVYGSTALGTAGLRSDVDVLINYHHNKADDVFPFIRETFEKAEADYKVPIESHILEVGALFSPLEHTIDPLYAEHLIAIQTQDDPRWSYNWPVDPLRYHQLDPEDCDNDRVRAIAVRYASSKARQFAKAIVGYREEVDVQVMQRALELPGAIGRKVIPATRKADEVTPDPGDKYALAEVTLAKLEEFAPEWCRRAVGYQRYLTKLDTTYDQLLDETLEGTSSMKGYQEWLDRNYLYACKMAYEVAHTWSEIVSHKMDIPFELKMDASGLPYESWDQEIY